MTRASDVTVELLEGASPPADDTGRTFDVLSVGELVQRFPRLRPPIIDGLLREGESMNLIAPPKTGKSWLIHGLAASIAVGRPWMGFETKAGRVLLADNELHPETLAHRLQRVLNAFGLSTAEATIDVLPLRGALCPLAGLAQFFEAVEPGRYALIALDAWYRFAPTGSDENSNSNVAELYNLLDAYAGQTGSAFVCVHHATKGSQTGKSVSDVGAGAGAQSRAADVHAVVRAHEADGCFVFDAVCRSFPPIDARVLEWVHPLWHARPDLDPSKLKPDRPRASKPPKDTPLMPAAVTVEQLVELVGAEPLARETILLLAEGRLKVSAARAEKLLKAAVDQKKLHTWPGKNGPGGSPSRFATVLPPAPARAADTEGQAKTPAPEPASKGERRPRRRQPRNPT